MGLVNYVERPLYSQDLTIARRAVWRTRYKNKVTGNFLVLLINGMRSRWFFKKAVQIEEL